MADSDGKVRIIIDTNAKEAEKAMDDVTKSFNKNAQTINKATSVYSGYEKVINENIQVLRELALGGNQNTEGFKQLAAQTRDYQKALQDANNEVNKATGNLQKQGSPLDALTSKLKSLAAAYLSIRGAQMAINAILQSTEAYRVQERAIASLNNTLANSGVYSREYSNQIQKLASEIQSYSNYGDEAIIKAQALGQSFIGQTKITEQLTRAVVDFAAATGMDLEQAFTLVGKSIGSSTNALGRYGVELKKGMTDSEKMISVAVQLGNRYEGQAKQMANATVQLKNAFGDLSEEIGGIFNPMVQKMQQTLINATKAMTNFIKEQRALNGEVINKNLDELEIRQQKLNQYFERTKKVPWRKQYEKGGSLYDEYQANIKALQETNKQIDILKSKQKDINKTPIKYNDDFGTSTTSSSTKSSSRVASAKTKAQEIKDAYDLATEAVEKARRAVLNAAIQFGESSPQVQQAFEQYKLANDKIAGLQDIFKTEETKTKFQLLQEEIQRTTEKLQNLYLSGQGGTDAFVTTKNHLSELQTQMQDMNTAITSNVGLSWDNVANSIRSNLTSALTTPLREGESAFDRLGKIGLNVVQQIGQEIITNLLKQVTLQSTLKAMGSIFSFFGGGGGIGGGIGMAMAGAIAKNGKVFNHGKVVPFARGGIVNKPTLFPMKNGMGLMGEAGAEAVMPLTRKNGRLGVEASGANQTVVNIYNQSGSSIETQTREDGSMDIFIRKFNSALNNERTSGSFRSAYQRESAKGVQAC